MNTAPAVNFALSKLIVGCGINPSTNETNESVEQVILLGLSYFVRSFLIGQLCFHFVLHGHLCALPYWQAAQTGRGQFARCFGKFPCLTITCISDIDKQWLDLL